MPPSVEAELAAVLNRATDLEPETDGTIATRAHYAPPWADVSIIGIAGSSGSGKSTLSHAIVNKLNLPWVVILSIVSSWTTRHKRLEKHRLMVSFLHVGLILQESGPRVFKEGVSQ
jgi:pantothenate kinase-related protein Tda10